MSSDLIWAYRHLYRSALRAVQYSKPARYTVRDQMRDAFRDPHGTLPDMKIVRRTIYFLNGAAAKRGLEHRIVRNLVLTNYHRRKLQQKQQQSWKEILQEKKKPFKPVMDTAYDHYDLTVAMLNKTMKLCLR